MSQLEIQEDSFSSDEDFDDEAEDTDSSSDADEKVAQDEVFDEEFFKCYSALKKKDSKIYDKNVKFFSNTEHSTKEVDGQGEEKPSLLGLDRKSRKENKMTILDHQLMVDNDAIEESESKINRPDLLLAQSQSYYDKELEEIKKSIVEASEDVESDSDEDLLVVRKTDIGAGPSKGSTPTPQKKVTILDKLEKEGDEDISHLKKIWSDPEKLSDDDKFLRDYILNKRYISTNVKDEDLGKGGFFSKNLDDMSDVDEEDEGEKSKKKHKTDHHSDEKDFDKIVRIPRNSTNTIRDLVEKQQKKEKRLKKMEKIKKKKKALKDADFEDIIGDLPTKFHYQEIEPVDYGMTAEEILLASDYEDDVEEEGAEKKVAIEPSTSKRKRKKKRKMNLEKFAKTGVAPDRLLAYGLSKSKLKKSKLL